MNPKRKIELDAKWKSVATQAVTDDRFKNRLVADPVAVMGENDLHVPTGVEVKIGSDKAVKLIVTDKADEAVQKEVQWWRWRLDIIREFGREEKEQGVEHTAPEQEEGI